MQVEELGRSGNDARGDAGGGSPANLVEVEIRGALGRRADDPNAVAAVATANEIQPGRFEVITAARVLGEIAAAQAGGARVLLLEVDCLGGSAGVGWALHDALRAFSAAGGRVVAHVVSAASSGVDVALAADLVVVAQVTDGCASVPPGFLVHAALADPRRSGADNERIRAEVRTETLRRIAPRVLTPVAELAAWLGVAESADDFVGVHLLPDVAVAHGWADTVGTLEEARAMAERIAAGAELPRLSRGAAVRPHPLVIAFPRHPFLGTGERSAEAQAIAMSKARAIYADSAPGLPLDAGDLWFSTDTTTNCPDSNCKGHTADANGNPQVGTYPHRAIYWPHRWTGAAWADGGGQQLVIAAEIAAGAVVAAKIGALAITGEKIHGDALATTDYAEPGLDPTAGAKMLANTTLTAWASNTTYSVGDKRSNGGKLYQCTTAGTSAGGASSWVAGTTYTTGNLVTYSGRTYYSLAAGNTNHQPDTSPTWWQDRGANTGPVALGTGIWDGSARWRTYAQLRVAPTGIQVGAYLFSAVGLTLSASTIKTQGDGTVFLMGTDLDIESVSVVDRGVSSPAPRYVVRVVCATTTSDAWDSSVAMVGQAFNDRTVPSGGPTVDTSTAYVAKEIMTGAPSQGTVDVGFQNTSTGAWLDPGASAVSFTLVRVAGH